MTIEDKIHNVFDWVDDSRLKLSKWEKADLEECEEYDEDGELDIPDEPIIDFKGALSETVLDNFAKNGLKMTYAAAYENMPGWMMILVKEI